jgi:hypothetical protein
VTASFHAAAFLLSALLTTAFLLTTASLAAAAVPPTSALDLLPAAGATTQAFSGTIEPNGESAQVYIEWAEEGENTFRFEKILTLAEGDVATTPVSGEVTGLNPDTTYLYRLDVETAGFGETKSPEPYATSHTAPVKPMIEEPGANVEGTTATLSARIAGGSSTTFHVDYGLSAAYGQNTLESMPIGTGNGIRQTLQEIEGLAPGQTYHWRLVATNSAGTTSSPDLTFTVPAAGGEVSGFTLPDGRAFEQVTSTDKEGASVKAQIQSRVAPDGEAVTYMSQSTLPGSEGAQEFGSYLGTRGLTGWSNQGLLPAPTGTESAVIGWSEDLSYSYVSNYIPGQGRTYFQRDNSTRALVPIVVNPEGAVVPIATSAGGEVFVFQSEAALTPGAAPGEQNLYIWNRASGVITLATTLNSSSAPVGGATVGAYSFLGTAVSAEGEDIWFTATQSGSIFLRRHAMRSQSMVDGSGKCTQGEAACTFEVSASRASASDPLAPRPAEFFAAATEGSPTAFFGSAEKLTDDATTGPNDEGFDLYRWEADGEKLSDLVPDPSPTEPNGAEVVGILGSSADASRLYFVANGVLGDGKAAGASRGDCDRGQTSEEGECNLYLWEAGAGIRFISRLSKHQKVPGGQPGGPYVSDELNWLAGRAQGGRGATAQSSARVSSDGSVLVFRSSLPLTGYANQGLAEFYRYDAHSGQLICLSCDRSGKSPIASATMYSFGAGSGPEINSQGLTRNLSTDGDRFVFESSDELVPEDVNGRNSCPLVPSSPAGFLGDRWHECQDVYQWEAAGIGSCPQSEARGCVNLISTGQGHEAAFAIGADSDGKNIFFLTSQQLVAQDKDELFDVYDARVGGGLATQTQTPQAPCGNEAGCRNAASMGAGGEGGSGSLRFSEPSVPVKCKQDQKKAQRRGKTTCVKRTTKKGKHHKKHHAKGHEKAKKTRGGSK